MVAILHCKCLWSVDCCAKVSTTWTQVFVAAVELGRRLKKQWGDSGRLPIILVHLYARDRLALLFWSLVLDLSLCLQSLVTVLAYRAGIIRFDSRTSILELFDLNAEGILMMK